MFKALRVLRSQGDQFIGDLRSAVPAGHRGRPVIGAAPCPDGCDACVKVCPTAAITAEPVRLDLARCVFCNECALACPEEKIVFTPEPRMSGARPEDLIVTAERPAPTPVATSEALRKVFGRSLKLRQVSAGGCNGCELELNALANVNFDLQRYGIEWVASPRHADGLVLTGPVSRHMAEAVQLAWDAMPSPRFLVAFGACALSGGLYADSSELDRSFLDRFAPSLLVPGCPPHPLTFVQGILDLLGIR
jgi:Ni,Fe-hydrogenase III small subunit/NAD-dependent dihydropyrimidine dehydrogenase PreA subunit